MLTFLKKSVIIIMKFKRREQEAHNLISGRATRRLFCNDGLSELKDARRVDAIICICILYSVFFLKNEK
jgi:hypothetical protein